ncbi:hypothetical protein [Xanthomonas arboricola]|uniref:hypothetical protein n=1 Tax=Xanthomonas arboricola TaxID=56448 RepID=UPI001F394A1D|nr:hypothetical protein [Xanthomonas arboricola]UJO02550.1 hypothetical protein K9U01_11910 [Xanthomonas arboricola pv. pruni]
MTTRSMFRVGISIITMIDCASSAFIYHLISLHYHVSTAGFTAPLTAQQADYRNGDHTG